MVRFFDNLSVVHYTGPMLEEEHYYPFGLAMAGICDKAVRSHYAENKYRYNGGTEMQNHEFTDGSGLEEYETSFRMYDPQLGRFWQIDPLADISEDYSPYSFAHDNPVLLNDPFGLADDTTTLPAVVVTPPPPQSRSTVSVGVANTSGNDADVAATAGPAPPKVARPIQSNEERQRWSDFTKQIGFDPYDFRYQQDHLVVRDATFSEHFFGPDKGELLLGYNWRNQPVTQKFYGGTAPIEGSFEGGIAALMSLRSARSWEELFQWGHNTDIISKLAATTVEDVNRLKNAGVTLEQVRAWGEFYSEAIFKKANVSNLTAKYRLDYINKLISLW